MKKIGRLHVLTDTVLQSRFTHAELAGFAIAGGADTIQFRQKQGPTGELIEVARNVKRLCAQAGGTFIVNDRLDVALSVGADGVHLGWHSMPVREVRRLIGDDMLIGKSVHNIEETSGAVEDAVDYLFASPVFHTPSKAGLVPILGLDGLQAIRAATDLPIVGLGGIDGSNAADVIGAGADGVAVIRAILQSPNPEAAAKDLAEAVAGRR